MNPENPLEEKLGEIEHILTTCVKLSSFFDLEGKVSRTIFDLSDIEKKVKILADEEAKNNHRDARLKSSEMRILAAEETMRSTLHSFKEMQKKIESSKELSDQAHANLYEEINSIKVSYLNQKFAEAVSKKFDSLEKDLFKFRSSCSENEKSVNEFARNVSQSIDSLKNEIKHAMHLITSLESKMKDFSKDLEAEKMRSDSRHESYMNHLHSLSRNFSKELADVRKMVESLPSPIDESRIKSVVNEAIYSSCLDAKNADMRSKNTELKLALLEKRLDQLNLHLSRIELAR